MGISLGRVVVALFAVFWLALAPASALAQAPPQAQERTRPWLGVTITDAYSETLAPEGARVYLVVAGSPASSAGMQASDLIVALNGRPTPTTHALVCAVQSKRPGDFVDLTVIRGGQSHTLTARLAPWPDAENAPPRRSDCGDDKISSATSRPHPAPGTAAQ